jgi:DHA2 family methylenomycin A resistance protein-like MFS transporter
MIPVGLAGPLTMPSVTVVLPDSVPAHRAGTASGVFNPSLLIAAVLLLATATASLRLKPAPQR